MNRHFQAPREVPRIFALGWIARGTDPLIRRNGLILYAKTRKVREVLGGAGHL